MNTLGCVKTHGGAAVAGSDTEQDTLRMRDYIDTRLDRVAVDAAAKAATLANRPDDAIGLQEYIETRLSTIAHEAAAERTAIRALFSQRIDMMTVAHDENLVVLRQLYDQRIAALDEEMDQRFRAQDHAVSVALIAQKDAVAVALAAQKEATVTAFDAVKQSNHDHAAAHERDHKSTELAVTMAATGANDRMTSLESSIDRRFGAAGQAVTTALDAVATERKLHAVSHEREHQQSAIAVEKQEKRYDEKHFDNNKFREQQNADRLDFVRRDNMDARLAAVIAMVEKAEEGLRSRIDLEVKARTEALEPLKAWQSRSGGQTAVWIALSGVILTIIIFLANFATS